MLTASELLFVVCPHGKTGLLYHLNDACVSNSCNEGIYETITQRVASMAMAHTIAKRSKIRIIP